MLSWSHSPLTKWRIGDVSPGTDGRLVGVRPVDAVFGRVEQDGDDLVLVGAVQDGDDRLLELGFRHGRSHSPSFALDADAPLDAADHVFGDPVDHRGIQHLRPQRLGRRRRRPGHGGRSPARPAPMPPRRARIARRLRAAAPRPRPARRARGARGARVAAAGRSLRYQCDLRRRPRHKARDGTIEPEQRPAAQRPIEPSDRCNAKPTNGSRAAASKRSWWARRAAATASPAARRMRVVSRSSAVRCVRWPVTNSRARHGTRRRSSRIVEVLTTGCTDPRKVAIRR